MPEFPKLKTGAVAQYPLSRGVRFLTQTVKFLDGSRQQYRLLGDGLRSWSVRLDQLEEHELSDVIAFVEQTGSAAFAFTDPVTGVNVPNCVISGESFEATVKEELRGQATLSIEEIP